MTAMVGNDDVPVPSPGRSVVVVAAPGEGTGYWAGGPSAVCDKTGVIWLAYRLRRPVGQGRGYANVVARTDDGESLETVAVLNREDFGCASLERPCLVNRPDGGWRLYLSCATQGTDHWRVDAIDADTPDALKPGSARPVLTGDEAIVGVKDPVVKAMGNQWHLWLCCHPLDVPDDTDRMSTRYGTSDDGITWRVGDEALTGTPGSWDQRGTRVAEVLHDNGQWLAFYDGRADKRENAEERTGTAEGTRPDRLVAHQGAIGANPDGTGSLRYLSVVNLPDGGRRLYYETSRLDGAHDLRTEYVPPSR